MVFLNEFWKTQSGEGTSGLGPVRTESRRLDSLHQLGDLDKAVARSWNALAGAEE